MMRLSDLALDMAEGQYHALPFLSYSILARYEREGGFKSLPQTWGELWAPQPKTDALVFGGAVDAIVTGGMEEFGARYRVADIPQTQDKVRQAMDALLDRGVPPCDTERVLGVIDEMAFYPSWRKETRLAKLNEGLAYYEAMRADDGRQVLDAATHARVLSVVDDLRRSPLAGALLFGDLPVGQERFFQLKFTAKFAGTPYKAMCDMIIADHARRTLHIYDLKTTGKESYSFRQSYLDWGYHIQSWLYRRILEEAVMMTDFDGYTVDGFSFIVASKTAGEPCVWDDMTPERTRRLRDPLTIGEEICDAYDDNGQRRAMPRWVSEKDRNIIAFDD